ncbi:MAG: efflux RND transporter permease subunit [Verrucomicrobiales bacterium]|nr:efflux RND transporter permease subunit [Verrucomicrobiales bacterium]
MKDEDKGIIYWFSRNHVAANFTMLMIGVLGLMTWPKLKKEIFPETSIDAVLISVPYPNATPEEVEKGIIVPIEEAIQDIDGIDLIRSTANQGAGNVQVDVESGFNVRNVMDDIKTRVDAVQNLAEEAEEPILQELLIKTQVMSIAVSADTDERTLREIAEQVRTGLLTYKGGKLQVTQASLAGVRDYEISIEVSEDTLRQFGITFDEVAAAVRKSSLDLPGGSVRTTGGEVLIRTEARRYTEGEFADITVVTRPDGTKVTLDQIANIRDEFEEDPIDTRFNGEPAILINVFRVGNEDTIKIAETVKQYVVEVAPGRMPEGVTLDIWKDDSRYLSGRLTLLAKNGIFGLILVTIVLALFLRPSLALLVAIGIPISFAGAIAMMPYTGISINMISLFAFILVLGIVVDDAIVVGENVYSRIRKGEDPKTAAPRGTHEVGIVVTFGILTTVMAFTPMLGLSGVSGKIWPNIPLIVIPTLLFSLIQSKLILPSHLALLKPYAEQKDPGPIIRFQRFFSRGLEKFIERFYRPGLRIALRSRYLVLTGFLVVFGLTVMTVSSGWIRFQFFPDVETDVVMAKLKLSQGVSYEKTTAAIQVIEEKGFELNDHFPKIDGQPLIRDMLTSIGTQPFQEGIQGAGGAPRSTNIGEVTIEMQEASKRTFTAKDVVSKWRELVGDIPGAVELTFSAEAAAGGNALDIELVGENLKDLEAATEDLKVALSKFNGVIDIGDSNLEGKREIKLEILPKAEALGLRMGDVARQVRQGFYGDEIQRLQRGKNEVKVFVRYPEEERKSIADLEDMKIRLANGTEVPFSEVARASLGRAYATIQRTDQLRAIRVTADVDNTVGANANEVVSALTAGSVQKTKSDRWKENIQNKLRSMRGLEPKPELAKGALLEITERYPGVTFSFEGEQKDQAQSVQEMGQKALIALLGMYVLMAIPLKSYVQPMIVMSVIPFGLVGAVAGHLIMDFSLSIMSMCGIVALAGVVVNDSLVLVDYVNRHVKDGQSLHDAAWEAGAARFRPILLTSLTTFAGLTPMLLETDIQAKFLIPMAVSLSFGILFATLITLILVPCIYLVMEDISQRFGHDRASHLQKAG